MARKQKKVWSPLLYIMPCWEVMFDWKILDKVLSIFSSSVDNWITVRWDFALKGRCCCCWCCCRCYCCCCCCCCWSNIWTCPLSDKRIVRARAAQNGFRWIVHLDSYIVNVCWSWDTKVWSNFSNWIYSFEYIVFVIHCLT